MEHRQYFIGHNVKYTGESRAITKSSFGTIVGYVKGEPSCIVEFGSDAYVIREENLKTHTFTDKEKGPEVVKISKKQNEN